MRILVLSSFLPSRESGGRVRLRALMRGLAPLHSVSLISFAPPGVDPAIVDEVRASYERVDIVPATHLSSRVRKRALQLRSLVGPS